MTSADVVATPATAEENIPLSDAALENWYAWCVKWDSVQGKRLYATITTLRARAEAAEAENARLRDALKDAAEELREIVSWTVTEKSKLRAQELDQIAVTQGKIRAALKAEGGEK